MGVISIRVRVDDRGRITLPKEVREALGIAPGVELLLTILNGRIVIEKSVNPFEKLKELLGDLSFDRGLRLEAERQALKEVEKR